MKPIVKWAGGKTQLLEKLIPLIPQDIKTYYEPFAGGLAVLFSLVPKKAIVNDINPELVNLYNNIKNNNDAFKNEISQMDNSFENSSDKKQFYFDTRNVFNCNLNTNTVEQAARFLFLNKHCFNGLWRVNSQGEFNVPFNGRLTGHSYVESDIDEVHNYLQKVKIMCGDFEKTVKNAKEGDFVFFDSPYAPLNAQSFTDYTKEGFEYADHVRLANLFKDLTKKKVKCLLTNHNTELINQLYEGFNKEVVEVNRMINADAKNRKGEEIIIRNYDI